MKRRKGLAFILALSLVLSSFSVAFATDVAEETTPVTETTTEAVAPVATATNTAFADIAGHWAKDAIVKWADYGVVKGSDGVFRPDAPLTRAEMATVLSNLMDYKVAAKNNFSDVATGAWYADAVLKANAAGVLSGDGSGLASPSANITREQATSMLARAFAVADANGTSSSLTDTQNISSWARPAVFGMEAAGYVRGFEGKFNPKNNITRAEVMTIINSAVKAYYTAAGTYTENVDGLAVVKVPGVVLKDVVISGNLIAAEGIASGDLTLDGKTEVKGKLIVRGGGENSIIIKGSAAVLSIEVSKVDGKVRIFADGALIKEITALKGEIILEGNFTNVEVKADATVIIKGNVGTLSMESKGTVDIQSGTVTTLDIPAGATATIAANATVTTANITGAADIKGTGAIGTANISGTGATIVQTPTAVNVADGGAATVGGKTVDGATSAAPSTGGGRGNSSNTVAVSAININKSTTTLVEGTTETLTVTFTPSNASNKTITWTTSDASKATIDSTGKVRAVSAGTATITAKSNNGKTATCVVTVTTTVVPVSAISVKGTGDATTIETNGGTLQMIATVSPDNASNKAVTWTVTETDGTATDKATISNTGLLTAVKNGTVKVTATAKDGSGKSGSVDITITNQVGADKNITAVTTLIDKNVAYGTDLAGVSLPTTVGVTLEDSTTKNLAVTWNGGTPSYNGNTAGEYVFEGTLTLEAGVKNTSSLKATIKVIVAEQEKVALPIITPSKTSATNREADVTFTVGEVTGVTFYYTLDGTEPTSSSTKYSSALTLTAPNEDTEKTITIKVIGIKDGFIKSDIATATVTYAAKGVTTYTVTVNNGTGNGNFAEGATVSITANAPVAGKVFDKWTSSDGVSFTDANAAITSFTMPAKAVAVEATYKDAPVITYTVTVSNDGNGTGTANPATAAAGTEITLAATANSGYQFKEWQVLSGGVTISSDKFTMPAGNVEVKAIFEEIFVPVTNIAGVPKNGTVGSEIDLTVASVAPSDATNKTIVWSVKDAGTTGVTTSNLATGKFTPSAAGTLQLMATITNGLTESSDYTQDFTITIAAAGTQADSFTETLEVVNATIDTEVTKADLEAGITNLPKDASTDAAAFTPNAKGDVTKDIEITFSDGSKKTVTVTVKIERIKITEVKATSTITAPVFGEQANTDANLPSFTTIEGSPAYLLADNTSNAHWMKKVGEEFKKYDSETFTAGTYIFRSQVRIDGDGASKYKLASPLKVMVGEDVWLEKGMPTVGDTYSYDSVSSIEYVITAPAYSLTTALTKTTVTVANGTSLEGAIAALDSTVGVVGTKGETGTATIAWTITSYDGNTAGNYTATGVLTLPSGWTGSPANVTATVTVTVDKTALTTAISEANTNKGTATVSANGTDIEPGNDWVTQAVMDAYTGAIAAAQAVVDNTSATQTEVDGAVSTLATATTTFDSAKKDGTKAADVEITGFDPIADVKRSGSGVYADATEVIAALPTTVTANSKSVTVPVTTWVNTDGYDSTKFGSYTFTATLGVIPAGYANTGGYTATVEVVILSEHFAAGFGTQDKPFEVSSAEQLNKVRNYPGDKVYFKQTANIDLSDYLAEGGAGYNEGKGWVPIGKDVFEERFYGNYDGGGFDITGLTIVSSEDCQGLFGYASQYTNLKNINLTGVDIKGKSYVGGLIGNFGFGQLENCHVSGKVEGTGNFVGGLAGLYNNSNVGEGMKNCSTSVDVIGINYVGGLAGKSGYTTIDSCYSKGSVTGADIVGGLVGNVASHSTNVKVTNSYSLASVKATGINGRVGGLVGLNQKAIENCYAAGKVTGNGTNAGGLVGENKDTITSSYYDSTITTQSDTGKGVGKTTEEMKQAATFTGWDEAIWKFEVGNYPTLR